MEVVRDNSQLEVVENQASFHDYHQHYETKPFVDYQQHYNGTDISAAPVSSNTATRGKWWWFVPAALGGLAAGVIIGGAVGGGLGASLAKCNDNTRELQQANSTTTITTTVTVTGTSIAVPTTTDGLLVNYEVAAPNSVYNVTMDCDKLSKTTQRAGRDQSYSVLCRTDIESGPRTDADGNRFFLGDMTGLRAYRFQDCIDACSTTNALVEMGKTEMGCKAVTYLNRLGDSNENCWLKNASVSVAHTSTSGDYAMSAILIE